MTFAKGVSIALGILSVILIGVGVVLLFVERVHETIIVPPGGGSSVPPDSGNNQGPPGPIEIVGYGDAPNGADNLWINIQEDLKAATSATSTVFPVPTNTPTFTPPGLVPYTDTFAFTHPLQAPIPRLGWIKTLPDASQVFSSLPNGYPGFAQYTSNVPSGSSNAIYVFNKDAYSPTDAGGFTNYVKAEYGKDNTINNEDASSVGCVGFKSIAISPDGLRLYVAYRQAFMGQDLLNASNFPFRSLVGRVAVFTRDATILAGGSPSGSSTSSNWSQNMTLSLSNPFGSQITTLEGYNADATGTASNVNPYTEAASTGDDFGQYMCASKDSEQNYLSIAIRSNYAYFREGGATIFIFLENTDKNQYVLQSSLQLNDGQQQDPDLHTFGQVFSLSDRWLFAWHPLANVVSVWKRSERKWTRVQTLSAPLGTENFGTSIHVDLLGRIAVIGAPAKATSSAPGKGGHVYMYTLNTTTDLWSTEPIDRLTNTEFQASFGYWVNVSHDFQVMSVSMNMDNRFNQKPSNDGPRSSNAPIIQFYSIDQINFKFLTPENESNSRMYISDANTNLPLDPTFGGAVSFGALGTSNDKYTVVSGVSYNAFWRYGNIVFKEKQTEIE